MYSVHGLEGSNIVKMSFLPKLLSRFAPVPVKTPRKICCGYRKLILIYMERQKHRKF